MPAVVLAAGSYAPEHPHWIPPEVRAPRLTIRKDQVEGLSPGQREQALVLLDDYDRIMREHRLQAYEPAGQKHHAFHLDDHRIRMFAGGNRAGKTWTGVVDDVLQMVPNGMVPDRLKIYKHHDCETQGPYKLRFVVPKLAKGGAPIKEALGLWLPKALLRGGSFDKAWKLREDNLTMECGCFMELLSCEQDVNAHGGTARHRIHYDEEPSQRHRVENTMRLASTGGDELFTFTPLEGLSWSYRELWKKRGDDRIGAHQVGMRDNRYLKEADVDFVLSVITNEAEKRQREFGEFAERGGAIYPNFIDGRRGQVTREQVANAEIFVGIDPGLRNAGFVWCAVDRDGNVFVFAAALLARKDVEDYRDLIKKVNDAWGIPHQKPRYIIDPAAKSGNLVTGKSVMDALADLGIYTEPGQNDVELGIMEVRRRLKHSALLYADCLTGLEDEAIEYAMDEGDDPEIEGTFKVVKRNDHRLDALRYVCMARPYDPIFRTESVQGLDQNIATGPPRKVAVHGQMGKYS